MKNKSTLSAVRRIARLIALLSYLSGVALPAASNAAEGHGHRVATMSKMKITIGSKSFIVTLYENPTVTALKLMLPLTLEMTELNRNEKYFHLTTELPMDAANPGTIQAGDLMLWQSNSLVLFYETFRTSYSYTKLGRIDDDSGLATAVGSGSVKVRLELERNGR